MDLNLQKQPHLRQEQGSKLQWSKLQEQNSKPEALPI